MHSLQNERRAWPIGATVFTVALGAAFAGYAIDVFTKARDVTDWMMILPAAVIGLIALAASLVEDWRTPAFSDDSEAEASDRAQAIRAIAFMAVLVAYVAAIPYAGFDIATFVFLATALLVQGERRPLVVLGFSAACALIVVWVFVSVLDVLLPTLLL